MSDPTKPYANLHEAIRRNLGCHQLLLDDIREIGEACCYTGCHFEEDHVASVENNLVNSIEAMKRAVGEWDEEADDE